MKEYKYKGFTFQHFIFHWYAIRENKIIGRDQYRHDLEHQIDHFLKEEEGNLNVGSKEQKGEHYEKKEQIDYRMKEKEQIDYGFIILVVALFVAIPIVIAIEGHYDNKFQIEKQEQRNKFVLDSLKVINK